MSRRLALLTALATALLIALGVWQLHRRAWKAGILARIDQAEQSPPVPLTGTPAPFAKVVASGTLGPEWALYGAEVRETPVARMGAGLLEILHRPGASPVLVDLGWLPEGGAPALGPARITGYARPAEHPGWLSAPDDPVQRHFYTLDPAAIGKALGVPGLAPFTLVALGPSRIGAAAPADALPRPPNNHLQYAFTWFGLAAALLAVVAAYARGARPR